MGWGGGEGERREEGRKRKKEGGVSAEKFGSALFFVCFGFGFAFWLVFFFSSCLLPLASLLLFSSFLFSFFFPLSLSSFFFQEEINFFKNFLSQTSGKKESEPTKNQNNKTALYFNTKCSSFFFWRGLGE